MKGSRYEKMFEGALLVLLVFTPFAFGSVQPWAFKAASAVLFLLSSLWFLMSAGNGGFSYVRTPLVYFPPLFLALAAVQVMPIPVWLTAAVSTGKAGLREASGLEGALDTLSLYPWATTGQALFTLSVLLLFLLVINLIRSRESVARITNTVLVVGGILAVLAFIQKASSPGAMSFLPFVNKNHFAGYMEMAVSMAAASLMVGIFTGAGGRGMSDSLNKAFSGPGAALAVSKAFLLVLMFSALLLTLSRGGMLGLAFSSAVLGALIARNKKRAAVFLAAVALVFAVSLWFADRDLAVRKAATLTELEEDGSAEFRLRIWKDTFRVFRDFPVTGVGFGAFETAYPFYKSFNKERNVFQPESDYLYVLAEGGAAGFILAGAFFIVFAGSVFSSFRKRKDPFSAGVAAGGLSALAALVMHGLVDTNLHMPSNLLLAAVLAALAFVAVNSRFGAGGKDLFERRTMVLRSRLSRAAMAAGAALSLLAAVWAATGSAGDLVYRSALREKARIAKDERKGKAVPADYERLVKRLALASRLDPGCAAYSFEQGMAYASLAELVSRMESGGSLPPGVSASWEYFEKAYRCFRDSMRLNPYSNFAHLMAGRMLENGLGDEEGGEEEYSVAERLNPTSPFIKQYLSQYYMKKGDMKKARDYAELLPSLDPNYNTVEVLSLEPVSGPSSAAVGAKVVWKAEARVLKGVLEYRFSVWRKGPNRWEDMTGYTKDATWVWNTEGEEKGPHVIRVQVRGTDGTADERTFVRREPFRLRGRE